MGNFHLNSGNIQDFNVELITEQHENSNITVVHATIETEANVVKYRVVDDDRHPDINKIANSLALGLQKAKDTEADFQINEYEERMYIFVTYPDGSTAQYTGSRI